VTGPRLAVAASPGEGGDSGRLRRSLEAAVAAGTGDFAEVVFLEGEPGEPRAVLEGAAGRAAERGCAFLLAADARETLRPDLLDKAAPALRLHEAVWGGAGLARPDGTGEALAKASRLAAQTPAMLFHAALRWWLGRTHFVRPQAALAALGQAGGEDWEAAYLAALFRGTSTFKTATAFTVFHGETLPPLPERLAVALVADLAADPVFLPVAWRAALVDLPYTGVNAGIEREHTRGAFFEADELGFLAARLPSGLHVVDVGANTGNHAAFFAAAMGARRVVALEPSAAAGAALRAAVARNRLAAIDLSRLGLAVGDMPMRMREVTSRSGGLGATRLVPDESGPVPALPLDALGLEAVDLLKIDVEGMEMAVLAGARDLIARCRPYVIVEVRDEAARDILAWIDANDYRIDRLFPDKEHCNYCLIPKERARSDARMRGPP